MHKRKVIKRKAIIGICLCLTLLLPTSAMAKDKSVTVAISRAPITVNGQEVDLSHSQYPLLSYRNVTYFPLTYYGSALLGIQSKWYTYNRQGGRVFFVGRDKRTETGIPDLSRAYPAKKANPRTVSAKVLNGQIAVNTLSRLGSEPFRQNINEEYPLLIFRNMVYFPLDWDYAVKQFGWSLSSDSKGNLIVDSTDPIRPILDPEEAMFSGMGHNPRVLAYVYTDTGYAGYPDSALLMERDYNFVYKVKGQPEKHFNLGKQLITSGFMGEYTFNEGLNMYGDPTTNDPTCLPQVIPPSLDGSTLTIRCVKTYEDGSKHHAEDLILKIDCDSEKIISQEPCTLSEEIPVPDSAITHDPAHPYGLNDQSIKFLQSHGVDINIFAKLKKYAYIQPLNDYIHSLEMQTEAYGFTDEQIQKYVEGMVNGPTH